ncbi:hypothetical protein CVT24_004036 [Panaeolus cyanescens]|uniref:Uncharacterized protein n=1 Tax=Panaeolus cyanescens TaxID=181874 RepID=A0A409Y666_9AGAR|nr:hypothetical protein CVT24_004036 [Panaeolus cyanescens]
MRRFASAFVKGRDKKTSKSSTSSLNTATTTTTTTTSTLTSESSTGSVAKYDESTKKSSWKSWLTRSRKPPPTNWAPSPISVSSNVAAVIDDDDDDDSSQLSAAFSPLVDPEVAKGNFRRIVSAALDDSHTSPSPFVQPTRGPLFPRSINPPSLLSSSSRSFLADFQRRQLLSRLESQVDVSPILPFAAKQPPPIPASHPSPNDICRPSSDSKLSSSSLGIQRWINRPCFEDRYLVYLPFEDGQVDAHPVTASSLAIAALEYSEHLDVMADPDFDQPPSKHGNQSSSPPSSTSHASISESPSLTASTRSNTSYTTAPSPLRNQHSPPPQLAAVQQPASDQSTSQPAIKSTVKRVVRFAEDDSDGEDGLPLHIIRMKKKREQKAQFLRQEQLRRAKQQEEERRRQEEEVIERERKRIQVERERKEREKERQEREKAIYAESVAAARVRREMQRAGGPNNSNSSNLVVPSSPSFTSLKDSERNKLSSKTPSLSIPRREASDSALHLNTPLVASNYFTDSSPSSSRPPSLTHSPVSPTYGPHSRPPSTYSTHSSSSEDARRGGSRRNSAVNAIPVALGSGGSTSSFHLPPVIGYPTWLTGGYIPPVPPFPEYANDMPLLPPTAPFMKHDKRSRNSSPGGNSTSSGSRRGSFTSSTERLDRPPNVRVSSSPIPRRDVAASGHSRQPSGDSSRSHSTQGRPPNPTHKSMPVISRGRSSLPPSHSQNQYLQAPSPWSALPSQFGTLPTSMPWSSSQVRQSQSLTQGTGGKQQRRQQTYPLVS